MQATISKSPFGNTSDGQMVSLFTLQNEAGGVVQITNYGGTIVSAKMPDRHGNLGEVMLGFDDLEGYLNMDSFFGSTVGRYANRIAKGRFSIDNDTFQLATNLGENHLHGGLKGFDKQIWDAEIVEENGAKSLKLSYSSPDGEEGYPGKLDCTVTFTFVKNNTLTMVYSAKTDKKTVVNLTNHAYFNLKDGGASSIDTHELKINASYITPVDATAIPTGKLMSVEETPFNFKNFKPIGKDIGEKNEQLGYGNGYDHNFVLDAAEQKLCIAAEVVEPFSGRALRVLTTEPGIQLYTANWVDTKGKNGIHYQNRSAFCLETQHFPDSPNQPNFPSTILDAGAVYTSTTVYQFLVMSF